MNLAGQAGMLAVTFSIQDISGSLMCTCLPHGHFCPGQVLKSFCSGKRDKGDFVAMSLALVMVPCSSDAGGHKCMRCMIHRKLPRLRLMDLNILNRASEDNIPQGRVASCGC